MTERARSTGPSGFFFSASLIAVVLGFGVFCDRLPLESPGAGALVYLDRDLAREGWSAEVRRTAAWAIRSNDHAGLPFVVVDQSRARLFAFRGNGRLVGSTRILRTHAWQHPPLPAGRFVADSRRSGNGTVVWVNERKAVSLRAAPADTSSKSPHRQLVWAALGNRAAAGSLHVAADFYRQHLRALLAADSVAYVLPDSAPVRRNSTIYASAPASSAPQPPVDKPARNLS